MTQRSLDARGVTFAIITGVLAGPILFYAFFGDYAHTTGIHISRGIAGAVGGVLALAAVLIAAQYRNAGLAGAISGLSGAVAEFLVAVLPWIGLNYTHPSCDGAACPVFAPQDLQQFALIVGVFCAVVFTLAGYSLSALTASIRARMR